MEIEVGEYVRTKFGRILRIDSSHDMGYIEKGNPYFRQQITKHSKRIIDLIEVGDIVQVKDTHFLDEDKKYMFDIAMLEALKLDIKNKDLEVLSILTHEQFEQNAYRLEESNV